MSIRRDTIVLDGDYLNRLITERFGSSRNMISVCHQQLAEKRSAISRALRGAPVVLELANLLADIFGIELSNLCADQPLVTSLSREHCCFYDALKLLTQRYRVSNSSCFASEPTGCVGIWLQERLRLTDDLLDSTLARLSRLSYIQESEQGEWVIAVNSIAKTKHLLKRRIQSQWPMIRDAFAATPRRRDRLSGKLWSLIDLATTNLYNPLDFFAVDEQIQESFCQYPEEVNLLHSNCAISWRITHELVAELLSQQEHAPRAAALSMKHIGGTIIEDYTKLASCISNPHFKELAIARRVFRQHVLRSLEHAMRYKFAPLSTDLGS